MRWLAGSKLRPLKVTLRRELATPKDGVRLLLRTELGSENRCPDQLRTLETKLPCENAKRMRLKPLI
jgi:hypothetical protein